jgi:hypothetical protein
MCNHSCNSAVMMLHSNNNYFKGKDFEVVIEQVRAMIKQEADFVAKTEKAYADANNNALDPQLSTNAYKGKTRPA